MHLAPLWTLAEGICGDAAYHRLWLGRLLDVLGVARHVLTQATQPRGVNRESKSWGAPHSSGG